MSSTIKSLLTAEAARNDRFLLGGESTNKKGRGRNRISQLLIWAVSSVHAQKGKSSPSLHAALALRDAEGRWPARQEPFSISEPRGVSLCALLCVRPERRREVGLEVSLATSPASCKDLSWPLPLVSWRALNWGIALGSRFSCWAATVRCSRGLFWEKFNLCVCEQVSEGEVLLLC